jgi:hypothetical protein
MAIRNTVLMAWSPLGAAWTDVVLAVVAVVDVLAVGVVVCGSLVDAVVCGSAVGVVGSAGVLVEVAVGTDVLLRVSAGSGVLVGVTSSPSPSVSAACAPVAAGAARVIAGAWVPRATSVVSSAAASNRMVKGVSALLALLTFISSPRERRAERASSK